MKRLFRLVAGCTLGGLLGLSQVAQATPPASWDRVSVGADARGTIVQQDEGDPVVTTERTSFRPAAYVSYSVTSILAVAAVVERDFPRSLTTATGGVRFKLATFGHGEIAAGVDLVSYSDEGAAGIENETSWRIPVRGNWPVAWRGDGSALAAGIIGADFDPDNSRTELHAGLRLQLWGGKPL